jgi:uncharacterized C2H2 Zn-finger protein
MKAKLIDDSNPDDPVLECPKCNHKSKFLWLHGCQELRCPKCGQNFVGVS